METYRKWCVLTHTQDPVEEAPMQKKNRISRSRDPYKVKVEAENLVSKDEEEKKKTTTLSWFQQMKGVSPKMAADSINLLSFFIPTGKEKKSFAFFVWRMGNLN